MTQHVHVKLNTGLPCKSSIQHEEDSFHKQTGLKLKGETSKVLLWSSVLYGSETWTLRGVGWTQKQLESFQMWCWRNMEKISWTDHVRNEAGLHRVKEERNILHAMKRVKDNWIWHILRMSCLLKHVNEGNIEGRIWVTWRRGRRCKQLLNEHKEKRGYW